MQNIWKKLNLKEHAKVLIINPPLSFESSIDELSKLDVFREVNTNQKVEFSLAFVTQREQIATLARTFVNRTTGDPVVWFAYPKGTSKRYDCDFNRDNGWDSLSDIGFRGVRQVAIDEDWSALRFRREEFVKSK